METGNSTTGDGNKQCREEIALRALSIDDRKTVEGVQLHIRVCYQKTNYCCKDHADKHEGGHIVSRLLQYPHRYDCCDEEISHDDVIPLCSGEIDRCCHTYGKHDDDQCYSDNGANALLHILELSLNETEYDGNNQEKHRDGSCGCAVKVLRNRTICCGLEAVEGGGGHRCEGCDNQYGEEPAEQ